MRVAIIPARGGSRRIHRKNIRDFHGKPIIAYSIEAARSAELFDAVVVTTRDEEIAGIASRYGAEVHLRSQEASRDECGTQQVMREVLEARRYTPFDEACCIYATAPLMTIKDLQDGYRVFSADIGTTWWAYVVGWFYFGTRESFVLSRPLHKNFVQIEPTNRWIDINTEKDWRRAERMYREMKEMEVA